MCAWLPCGGFCPDNQVSATILALKLDGNYASRAAKAKAGVELALSRHNRPQVPHNEIARTMVGKGGKMMTLKDMKMSDGMATCDEMSMMENSQNMRQLVEALVGVHSSWIAGRQKTRQVEA